MYVCTQTVCSDYEIQKRASEPLELQPVVWVLRIELGLFGRAVNKCF